MAAAARIDALIKQFPVFVVSKSYCPFCHMAKDVLNKYKIPQDKMKIVEIENDPDCGEIQDHMLKITGGRTVRFIIQGAAKLSKQRKMTIAHQSYIKVTISFFEKCWHT